MHELTDMIKINKNFQKSINMRLDYNQFEKINSYIPTRASVQVLKEYLQEFAQNKSVRSTILIGPYGKGKSHLLLVLLALLSRLNQVQKRSGEDILLRTIIEKIKQVDEEAGAAGELLLQQNKYYLPVLVNGGQNDLNKSFLFALKEGLERDGLSEVAPDTYFDEAIKVIKQWKGSYPDTFTLFSSYLQKENKTPEEFVKELEMYKEASLQFFREIYPKLTSGSTFEPMVQMDVITLYKSINDTICKKYGYSGIVVIFDEFSKFVEGYPKERFSAAMEVLQNLCELANHSKEQELHVILVAHKAMKEYKNSLPKEVINAYEGVEGRISEIYFTTSLKNSYELIKQVIGKDKELFECEVVEKKEFLEFQKEAYALPYFKSMFAWEEFFEVVGKGCYPLTPVATYLLLKISEIAVQNERTVFTFLANDEPHSLLDFITQQKEICFLTAGVVYDYFSNVLKSDSTNRMIHNEWLKAEYALSKERTRAEQEIIKTIALIQMIGKYDDMFATNEVIRIGAGLSEQEFDETIESLKEQQILLFRSKTQTYAFKNNIGVDVEKEIAQVAQTKFSRINVCQELEVFSELEYELPKRYNQKYTMTRYFHYHYMTVQEFLALADTSYLFEDKFADGKIIALVKNRETEKEKIIEHLKELQDERIVVIYPEQLFELEDILCKILSIDFLKHSKEFMEENKALEQELNLYEEDLLFELNAKLEQYYLPLHGACCVLHGDKSYPASEFVQKKSDSKYNQLLSTIFENYYSDTPKINNELINKRVLTAQIKKARHHIIERLLEKEDCTDYLKGTNPESTIFRAVFVRTGIITEAEKEDNAEYKVENGVQGLLQEIDTFIQRSAGEKQCFIDLYKTLLGKKIGVRKGVLPLYLAYGISKWNEMPVISLGEREVALDATIFENINQRPEEYFLYIEKDTVEKEQYLSELEEIFGVEEERAVSFHKINRLKILSDEMYRWFCSLPQCSKTYSTKDMDEHEKKGMETFRRVFLKMERNPREIFFETLPQAFGTETYSELLVKLRKIKEQSEEYVLELKKQAVQVTREKLRLKEENDLLLSLKNWCAVYGDTEKGFVHSKTIEKFFSLIQQISTHDELEIVEKISKQLLDLFIEDWKENGIQQYSNALSRMRMELEQLSDEDEQKDELQKIIFTNSKGREIEKYFQIEEEDVTSNFLQNEMESALEEYGDTLETNQKISVMVRMIEKLLEGEV